jgi:hypothetical protein
MRHLLRLTALTLVLAMLGCSNSPSNPTSAGAGSTDRAKGPSTPPPKPPPP